MLGSDRLQVLTESSTLALAKKVRNMIVEGHDVVSLTLGEPDFDTPDHIREAGIQAIRDGHTHYPPVAGLPDLREAVAAYYRETYGLSFEAANVMVSTGAKQSVLNAVMSLINPGERAVVIAPFWVSYSEMLKMAEAKMDVVETTVDEGYILSPEKLEAAITPETTLLIFNNPSNPTGATYSEEELAALVEVLERHPQVYIISDEIYEFITYDRPAQCLANFESIRDRVVVINGVSKGYAMTGWRIGFTIAPQEITALCEKYQGQVTSGASTISQYAALAAVSGPKEASWEMRDSFRKRRDFVYEELCKIPGLKTPLPEGAFYFYPDLSAFLGKRTPKGEVLEDIVQLCDYLLEDGLVAVVPGNGFGTQQHARLSYAYSVDTLKIALERIRTSLLALS